MTSQGHKRGDYSARGRPFEEERQRLRQLAASMNEESQDVIRRLGIAPGWRCLEVGAAEGSMSRWMAEQIGLSGRVLACDIDTRFLADLALRQVEVRELDVRSDELGEEGFDLAYCRTVLLHLPDPTAALAKMRDALVSGGWLFAQEPDVCINQPADPDHPDAALFEGLHRRVYDTMREKKLYDTRLGRTLPDTFARLGLREIGVEARAAFEHGGSPASEAQRLTLEAMASRLVRKGVVTGAELARVGELLADPSFAYLTGLRVFIWGRRA